MIVHPFYRKYNLRLHEIPAGVKCPVVKDWPNSAKTADDVEPLLDGERINKYGWLLDENHVVIDIDVHDEKANGFDSLAKLESEVGFTLLDCCGAVVDTPSGGRHYYFSKPADVKFGKVFRDKYPGIDFINGKGKQVIAAGSAHDSHSGFYRMSPDAELVEIPERLINHLCDITEAKKPTAKIYTPPIVADRAGDEFNTSDAGIRLLIQEMEQRGYVFRHCGDYYEYDRPNKTTDSKCSGHVGKKSKQGNYQLTSFTLSDPFFTSGESVAIFHAYAILTTGGNHTEAAKLLFGKGFAVAEYPQVDLSFLLLGAERDDDFDDEDFAKSCIPESGLLRDIYDYYCQIAHRKSDVMGLAVAVSLCETLFGRRVASHTDLRTNDYNVIIAPTNCGKEACEKAVVKILEAANHEHKFLIPADVQSGNGLVKSMVHSKCALWVADEFGKVLASILDKKQKSSHLIQIATHLLKMYGKADATYTGAAHSDGNRNKIIQPHLCVLGLTTGSTLFESVDASNVSDGLFGRIAFWPVQSRPVRRRMNKVDPDAKMVERVRQWMNWEPTGNLGSEYPAPPAIAMSQAAFARWEAHAAAIDDRMESEKETRSAIWGRVAARSMKLGLVHMAARQDCDPGQIAWEFLEIELADIEWGIKISNWLGRIACELISQNFVDYSARKNRSVIMEALNQCSEIKTRDILRACRRMTKGELMAEAKELQAEGFIEIVTTRTGGRPSVSLKRVGA